MKLEFLDNISNNRQFKGVITNQLVRLYDFDAVQGFPFIYYIQFLIEPPIPNSGWNINNLILDCSLLWLIVFAIYSWIFRNKKKCLK